MKTESINDKQFKVYDNGGRSCDRFTVVYLFDRNTRNGFYPGLAMNEKPFHPQGFGQHCDCQDGSHLGKRIAFSELPADCQKLVRQDLAN